MGASSGSRIELNAPANSLVPQRSGAGHGHFRNRALRAPDGSRREFFRQGTNSANAAPGHI